MKQTQSIGNQAQEQERPSTQKTARANNEVMPKSTPDKPQVTDDNGNAVDKKKTDAGKGYNETKPTEAGSNIPQPPETKPSKKPAEPKEWMSEKRVHVDEQAKPEEVEKFLKRAKQAENVQG
jgi:hypothetical protein